MMVLMMKTIMAILMMMLLKKKKMKEEEDTRPCKVLLKVTLAFLRSISTTVKPSKNENDSELL